MGRYLDLAANVIAVLDTDSRCEKSELSEITPQCETWGAAAASTKIVLLHVPPGVPEAWVQGTADLLAMAPSSSCPAGWWQTLREDAYRFLRDHAAEAHQVGWTVHDLFAVDRRAPMARLDHMGLVPLLNGRAVVALSKDQAAIKTPSGGTLTYYRRPERRAGTGACLLWELDMGGIDYADTPF